MGYKVAVVGATGNVGKEVSFGEEKILVVQDLAKYDFKGTQIGLFSPGASVSKIHAPRAAEAGCVVIDNTSHFRMMDDIPLVVPEVNPEALKNFRHKNIIANPNCSTIQMVVALKPLHDAAKIKRVVVSTYQSVSGAGKEGMDELYDQTKKTFSYDKADPKKFTKQIAYNVIPHIDVFMDDGMTKEEWKMVHETKKILDPKIEISATCVRVPVFVGHSESVNIEFENAITPEEAREILDNAPGCVVVDRQENGGYATPIEAVGEDATYISRIRKDPTVKHGLNMWVVSDNVRKGAALNSIQIAEELIKNYGL